MTVDVAELRKVAMLPDSAIVPDASLTPFTDFAALVIAEDLAESGYSQDRLDMIELYLAAHAVVVSREFGGLTSQAVGQSLEKYQLISDSRYGLASTRFGQTVTLMDTSGVLAGLSAPAQKAFFQVL